MIQPVMLYSILIAAAVRLVTGWRENIPLKNSEH